MLISGTSVPTVAVCITPHGYGHAAITGAVLQALSDLCKGQINFHIMTLVPEFFFRRRWPRLSFRYVPRACAADVGMQMVSSTVVNRPGTVALYRQAWQQREQIVLQERDVLCRLGADLVLSCSSFTPLAAARQAGIPGVALGPFTWIDILSSYFSGVAEMQPVLDWVRRIYQEVDLLIETTPAVDSHSWSSSLASRRQTVGPVATPARPLPPEELRQRLGIRGAGKVALLTMGGMEEPLPAVPWPCGEGWHWVVPDLRGEAWEKESQACSAEAAGISVSRMIASCDAVITKPGYGTFVEAACAGTPLLYRQRPDWPETRGLARWLAGYAGIAELGDDPCHQGDIIPLLDRIVRQPSSPLGEPEGNHQAAELLAHIIS